MTREDLMQLPFSQIRALRELLDSVTRERDAERRATFAERLEALRTEFDMTERRNPPKRGRGRPRKVKPEPMDGVELAQRNGADT